MHIYGVAQRVLGTATNSGAGTLAIGNDTYLGALASVGNVNVADRAHATSVTTSGTETPGNQDIIGTISQHALLTPLVHRSFTTMAPAGTLTSVTLPPQQSGSPSPGSYDQFVVGASASLSLTAGNYILNSLDVEPQATVNLDTSHGAIHIYVANSWIWHAGTTKGDTSRLFVEYLGRSAMSLEAPFSGTVLAPYSTLNFATVQGTYNGTYYGKDVVIQPGVTIIEVPPPLLIDTLTVSNTSPCVGQNTEVTVSVPGAGPGVTTMINGVVGSHQLLQFSDASGPRMIYATVYTSDGRADFMSVPITVQHCTPPAGSPPPMALHYWGATGMRYGVEFVVHAYDSNFHEIPATGPATYVWTFGDGQTLTTTAPLVQHDYTASMKPLDEYTYFNASVSVTSASGTTTVAKIVPVWNLYVVNRAKGIIQPPSTFSVSGSNLNLTVTNFETTPLSFTSAAIELLPCDPNLDARPQTPVPLTATIPASATVTVNVPPPTSIPSDVCGLAAHLLGTTSAGRVYADGSSRLKENPLLRTYVTDSNTIALLNQASALTADPNQFDDNELRTLYAQGQIPSLPPAQPPGTTYAGVDDVCGQTVNPQQDAECCPGDARTQAGLSCQPTADWVINPPEILNAYKGDFTMDHGCGVIGQLLSAIGAKYSHMEVVSRNRVEVRHSTSAPDRVTDTANYANATLNGTVLRYGYPGSHGTGPENSYTIDQIITSYQVQVPSNTSAGDANAWYTMGGELTPTPVLCPHESTAVPGLVVRPAPDAPASVFPVIGGDGGTGDQSFAINAHYRFVQYSHADQQQPGGDWATGTTATVCSSFTRLAAANAINSVGSGTGLLLWPTRQASDFNTYGQREPDGMRFYNTDTRNAAAQALYQSMSNLVAKSCQPAGSLGGAAAFFVGGAATLIGGPLGDAVVGAAVGAEYCSTFEDQAGNQMVNCFNDDTCDDGSNKWMSNVGTGVALSPDDILAWDPYNIVGNGSMHGTYGYNVPFDYEASSVRHKYQWTAAQGTGTLQSSVVDQNGTPVGYTSIAANGIAYGNTDANGNITIPGLPSGSYTLDAQACVLVEPDGGITTWLLNGTCGGVDVSGTATRQLASGQTLPVTLSICIQPALGSDAATTGPVSCLQPCNPNGQDCDTTQMCDTTKPIGTNLGTCVPQPRAVHIAGSTLINVNQYADWCTIAFGGGSTPTFDLYCDPYGQSQVHWSYCQKNGLGNNSATFDITFDCAQDPSGALQIHGHYAIEDSCDPNQVKQAEDTYTTLLPATPTDPNPTGQALDASGNSPQVCFTDVQVCTPSNPCQDNVAEADVVYTNVQP